MGVVSAHLIWMGNPHFDRTLPIRGDGHHCIIETNQIYWQSPRLHHFAVLGEETGSYNAASRVLSFTFSLFLHFTCSILCLINPLTHCKQSTSWKHYNQDPWTEATIPKHRWYSNLFHWFNYSGRVANYLWTAIVPVRDELWSNALISPCCAKKLAAIALPPESFHSIYIVSLPSFYLLNQVFDQSTGNRIRDGNTTTRTHEQKKQFSKK